MVYKSIKDRLGNTPVVKFDYPEIPEVEIFIKLEGENPSGSIKDRTVYFCICDAIENHGLTREKELVDVSSGNYACGLALFAKVMGFKATVVTGAKLTPDKEFYVEYFGTRLIKQNGFTFDGIKLVKEEIIAEDPDRYYFLDQLHNPANADIHYMTTGPEILNDIPDVAAVAFTAGSSGSLAGVSRFFREKKPDTKIISTFSGHGVSIPGTGAYMDGEYKTPFFIDMYGGERIDKTYTMENMEVVYNRVKQLRDRGFFVGLSTGAALESMIRGIKELDIKGKVLVISGDSAWKYVSTYKSYKW